MHSEERNAFSSHSQSPWCLDRSHYRMLTGELAMWPGAMQVFVEREQLRREREAKGCLAASLRPVPREQAPFAT